RIAKHPDFGGTARGFFRPGQGNNKNPTLFCLDRRQCHGKAKSERVLLSRRLEGNGPGFSRERAGSAALVDFWNGAWREIGRPQGHLFHRSTGKLKTDSL